MTAPIRYAAFAALCLTAYPTSAQTVWDMPTEYPANAMPGEGIAFFAETLAKKSNGQVTIRPSYNAEKGIKSGQMIAAVREGKVQAGDAFSGPMAETSAIFGLSALPFLAFSVEDAKKLADAARPAYDKVLAGLGLKLLYTTPWPPSGIWSKDAIGGAASLKGLAIRTYDGTSTAVMAGAGAVSANISFADVMPKLKDGSMTAVLSSGDGGAGRKLWEYLPHFTEISYAYPLSLAFVSASAYEALPAEAKAAVDAAAAETEARQWATIRGRLDVNYARMRENGVKIADRIEISLADALKQAAAPVIEDWAKKAGPDGAAVLAGFARK